MKLIKRVAAIAAIAALSAAANAQTAGKRAITFRDMISMHRVSDPQISPDGRWIAYVVATPDVEANKSSRDIWLVPVAGGESRQLTHDGTDERPRWSPDGKRLAFLSSRGGVQQVYLASAIYTRWPGDAPDYTRWSSEEPVRVSSLSGGADAELWSPDGKSISFVSSVYPDCKDDACDVARDKEKESSKVKAHVYDKLLYRHWTAWADGKRSHLFVVSLDGGTAHDLTPGADYDTPPFSLDGAEAIGFSPDSQELCFTANTDKDEATSTNGDLFTVPVSGASAPKRITSNPGDDWGPDYSPDGKWIAYRAQMQPGYESDRWRLMLYDRASGKPIDLTETFDRNVNSIAWSPDSKTIYFQTEDKAEMPVYSIAAGPGSTPKIVLDSFNAEFDVSHDGHVLAFTRTSLAVPAEVFVANADGTGVRQLTHQNTDLVSQLDLPTAEPMWFEGAEKTQVEGLVIRPPHFDPSKKYPLLLLIHGGPQGEWDDAWSYRWNPQVMAAPGYVALLINPRGSFGYGHKFTEEISKDWGGKVYDDLMKGVDAAIAKYPFIDGSRMAAAGGSYGGYMVDWIATHNGRFKCLISHAGPWDQVSMYGATEELWFPEWELGGTPWSNPELYKKWSSSEYAGALGKYKTPTLVIAGELDFRVPYTQSLEFFTALQRQGVPSKLMVFPDEGHWILKPQNSQLWYKTFLDWLAKYLT